MGSVTLKPLALLLIWFVTGDHSAGGVRLVALSKIQSLAQLGHVRVKSLAVVVMTKPGSGS